MEVSAESWSFELENRLLKISDGLSGGYSPSYLQAAGTADLVLRTDTGMASETVCLSADGGSALPLTEERGSVFEYSLEGGCSLISQLMTYQLSALAQYRVINGWGAFGT